MSHAGDRCHSGQHVLVRETELFAAALYADSNLELDWLWMAMQMDEPLFRRYCLRRALLINPDSEPALRELVILNRNQRPRLMRSRAVPA